ncbi:MAG: hypothetical protein CSA21_06035 [Deltaproteobacteria bacterium]|nr:MAG: hypothetical protein CSA21_06035 [Deltaproteobacteria bacterium]
MAATNLLALIDDIASLLDDISLMTKVAARKTAGVLGDDLAVNAEQVAGVRADRELPVVWAVAKGSLLNKCILVPAALGISALVPWLITPILMLGGAFLCFEGFEKVAHAILHREEKQALRHQRMEAVSNPAIDMVAYERKKVRGAIRTDAILSAEIIVITLGIVADATFMVRLAVLSLIAFVMTIGVYGLVAGIVKLDDVGLYLSRQEGESHFIRFQAWLGQMILRAAPVLMKVLSIGGTAAMFLVGGGILVHGFPGFHEIVHHVALALDALPALQAVSATMSSLLVNAGVGILAGGLLTGTLALGKRLFVGKAG